MTNLTFVYRTGDVPQRMFQGDRPGFLTSGSVDLQDGFVTDEFGHTTTYTTLRPLFFVQPEDPYHSSAIQPGDRGINPFNFLAGRVGLRLPEFKTLLFSLSGAQNHQFHEGRITLQAVSSVLGALTNFSFWKDDQADPYEFYIDSATNQHSAGVGGGFTRQHAVFVPHRETKYLAVGAKAYAMPNTGAWRSQYFKKWMLEQAPVDAAMPSESYHPAREVVVTVKPDRLNYAPNPSFEVGTSAVQVLGDDTVDRISVEDAAEGVSFARIVRGSTSGSTLFQYTPVIYPHNQWISWRMAARLSPTSPVDTSRFDIGVRCFTEDGVDLGPADGAGTSVVLTKSWQIIGLDGGRTLDDVAVNHVRFLFTPSATLASGCGVDLDGILIEPSPRVGLYFDGSTSADTIWETGGVAGASRSYLYKNRAERFGVIKRTLKANVPLGIGIADPIFGTLPLDSYISNPSSWQFELDFNILGDGDLNFNLLNDNDIYDGNE